MHRISLTPPLYDEAREARLLCSELRSLHVTYSDDEASQLLFISRRKYDRFDLFAPGETFQSRLPAWLQNFKPEDRQVAMQVVANLTFVSHAELRALAVGAFNIVVNELVPQTESDGKSGWNVLVDRDQVSLARALRRTLFVAATDDVLFDFFRRRAQLSCDELGRENFVEYYKFHPDEQPDPVDCDLVVLIDQFSGSGTSFLRKEDGEWKGKLPTYARLWDRHSTVKVLYVPYMMTQVAYARVMKRLPTWCFETGGRTILVRPVMILPFSPCVASADGSKLDADRPVARLCEKYHTRFHDNVHTRKGGPTPLGFGQAGLTLVLNSNVPNNSLPIIWHKYEGWQPLFPRVEHHREVG